MRFSGLAIGDAATIRRDELVYDTSRETWRVVTSRQKTGTHVSVLLPRGLGDALHKVAERCEHPDYVFWNWRGGQRKAAVDVWERAMRRIFRSAGIINGHSHQLRDTFAVALLSKGVPIEEVAKLLGHSSIRTTERSYSPWVRTRQDRLDALIEATF
jgi:integrase/recombinase XerD